MYVPLYTHIPLQLPTALTEHPRMQAPQAPAHTVPSTPVQDLGLHTQRQCHETLRHHRLPSEWQGSASPPPPPQHWLEVLRNAYL